MFTSYIPSSVAVTLCLVAASGCAHAVRPSTTAATVVVSAPLLAPASPGKTNSSIYLSDRLRAACSIATIGSAKDAPKFDFDKSAILPEDSDVLGEIAACLTTGPLKGRSVKLVGRADPRGTAEYNMALGERRSNNALRYLTGLGVPAAQLTETSRGALDATGSDESAWRLDRRVDIDILGT